MNKKESMNIKNLVNSINAEKNLNNSLLDFKPGSEEYKKFVELFEQLSVAEKTLLLKEFLTNSTLENLQSDFPQSFLHIEEVKSIVLEIGYN